MTTGWPPNEFKLGRKGGSQATVKEEERPRSAHEGEKGPRLSVLIPSIQPLVCLPQTGTQKPQGFGKGFDGRGKLHLRGSGGSADYVGPHGHCTALDFTLNAIGKHSRTWTSCFHRPTLPAGTPAWEDAVIRDTTVM